MDRDRRDEEARRRRWMAIVVAYCSMTTGLAMTYIAFVLGTEIATFRVIVETKIGVARSDGVDPGSPFSADATDPDGSTMDCQAMRPDIARELRRLYENDGKTVRLDSVFFSAVTGTCVYEASIFKDETGGRRVTWLLEIFDGGATQRRLVVMDAIVGAEDHDTKRREYERRVMNDYVAPPEE